MYYHFTFQDGSNPYIAKTGAELFRMICKYNVIQTGETDFEVTAENAFLTVTGRKLTAREKAKAALQAFAADWAFMFTEFPYSLGEVAEYQNFFAEYGRKYGLLREFRANAIC